MVDRVWDQLFPAEQQRLVRLLVERVIVVPTNLELRLRPSGVGRLAADARQAAEAVARTARSCRGRAGQRSDRQRWGIVLNVPIALRQRSGRRVVAVGGSECESKQRTRIGATPLQLALACSHHRKEACPTRASRG